jgi:glycosyltransferase involved in cell wall biosynthesis
MQGDWLQQVPYQPEIEVSGYFEQYSGYGNETLSLAKALAPMFPAAAARNVVGPLPPEVALMFTRDVSRVKDSIILSPPFALDTAVISSKETRMHVISMWETTELPEEFINSFKHAVNIFCPCPQSVETFQKFAPDKTVRLLTFGTESDFWGPPVPRDWGGVLQFGMVGAFSPRKYTLETIKAFRTAFGDREDVHFELLNSDGNASFLQYMVQEDKNITFRTTLARLPNTELRRWYQSKHVLLMPSRGEGNGRPILEMGCTGGAIVATKGMGMYWVSDAVGYPISFEWVPVKGFPWRTGEWMEPNFDELVETLKYIDHHRGETAERARALAAVLPNMFDWDKTATNLLNMI